MPAPRRLYVCGIVSVPTSAHNGRREQVRPLKEPSGGRAITRNLNAAALDAGRLRLDIALIELGWGRWFATPVKTIDRRMTACQRPMPMS